MEVGCEIQDLRPGGPASELRRSFVSLRVVRKCDVSEILVGFLSQVLSDLNEIGIRPGAAIGDCGSQDFGAGEMPAVNHLLSTIYKRDPLPLSMITSAAEVFVRAGFNYTCFDVDNRSGTVYLDFHSFRFQREYYNKFDITFNSGTSEHLIAPHGLMFFMHHATRVGGLMWHMVPVFGYANHGLNNLTPKFWHQLATYNGYEIVSAEIELSKHEEMNPNNFYGDHLSFIDNITSIVTPSALMKIVFRKIIDRCFIPPFDVDDPSPSPQTEKLMRDALQPFVDAGSLTYVEINSAMNSLFGRVGAGSQVVVWKHGAMEIQAACDYTNKLAGEGEYETAEILWSSIVEQFPAHAEAKFQLARSVLEVARHKAAILTSEAAVLDPRNPAYKKNHGISNLARLAGMAFSCIRWGNSRR